MPILVLPQRLLPRLRHRLCGDRLLAALLAGFAVSLLALPNDAHGALLSLLTLVVGLRLALAGLPVPVPRVAAGAVVLLALAAAGGLVLGDPQRTLTALTRLLHMLALAAAVLLLAPGGLAARMAPWLAGLAVLAHFAALHAFGRPDGLFTNPHYLAQMSLLAVAVLGWRAAAAPRPAERVLWGVLIVLALDLLARTNSAAGQLGLVLALAAALPLAAGPRAAGAALGALAELVVLFWITGWGGAADQAWAKLSHLMADERARIWQDAWDMLWAGPPTAWIFGHGIGSFREVFPAVTAPEHAWLVFPHNHALEIAYESGVPAALAACVLVACLFAAAVRGLRGRAGRERAAPAAVLFALIAWGVLAFLVFPFYSKSSVYPLGVLAGAALAAGGPRPSRRPDAP